MTILDSPTIGRAPSRVLRELLISEGFLAPLLSKRKRNGIELQPHLRSNDEVHLYCGLTCLVKVRLGRDGKVRVFSHKTYCKQDIASRLFRQPLTKKVGKNYFRVIWRLDEIGFADALDAFLDGVEISDRHTKEGAIQAQWAQIHEPWTIFDKEVRLTYPSKEERQIFMAERMLRPVERVRDNLSAFVSSQRSRCAMPPHPKRSLKLDALAVDPQGNMVLVEIKDGSRRNANVYYSPFQLLQNLWEWHYALSFVRSSVQELLDSRVELGLTSRNVPRIEGGIRSAVGFGNDVPSGRTRDRYFEVLEIVNSFLPEGTLPIESWAFSNGDPIRMD